MSLVKHIGAAGVLDPQVVDFLATQEESDIPLSTVSAVEFRENKGSEDDYAYEIPEIMTEEITVPSRELHQIKIRIYRKSSTQNAPALIYYHGGCWVFCDLDSHDGICRKLANDSGCTVFSVDYRLAPENKFPAAVNDAFDAAVYIADNFQNLSLTDASPIVSGDSAGANIANAVSMMARKSDILTIKAQVLFYPITDITSLDTDSYIKFAKGYFLSKELMAWGAHFYINNEQQRHEPLVSPLWAEDLSDMPATLIQTAEFDVLRDEAEAYAHKLYDAGTAVDCVRYNGLIHAYVGLAAKIDAGDRAVKDALEFIQKSL